MEDVCWCCEVTVCIISFYYGHDTLQIHFFLHFVTGYDCQPFPSYTCLSVSCYRLHCFSFRFSPLLRLFGRCAASSERIKETLSIVDWNVDGGKF